MFKVLFLAVLFTLGQKPETAKAPQFGTIAGVVVAPQGTSIKQPLQVVLLSKEYSDLWIATVQQHEDNYWERYKPQLAQKKELFFQLSLQAYQDGLQTVVDKMRSDLGSSFGKFSKNTSVDGKFDFQNVPLGDYRVLAVGRVGNTPAVWAEWVTLTDSVPHFVQLKKLP